MPLGAVLGRRRCWAPAPAARHACFTAPAAHPQLSVDISCPRSAQQQTRRTPLLLSIDGTETDGRTIDRSIDPAPRTMRAASKTDYRPDMELGHWVTGSMGHLGHLSRPGHRVIILTRCETWVFPVFEKKPKIKIYEDIYFCEIRPTVIEILTFNKWSSNFTFQKHANAKQR